MRHEKLIKRPSGEVVKIEVEFYCEMLTNNFNYRISIYSKGFRKRSWILRYEEGYHQVWGRDKFVTDEEIQEAKMELWQQLKPSFNGIYPHSFI